MYVYLKHCEGQGAFSKASPCVSTIVSYHNLAVTLHHRRLRNELAERVADDPSAERVNDRVDAAANVRLDLGVLKGEVGVYHFAVDEAEIFAVAERLCADDAAVLEGQTVGEPCEVLAFDGRIFDGDVLRVPKGILRVEIRVGYGEVVHVLK